MNDRLEALERLTRLRDSGALSQDEFAAEKARILAMQAPTDDASPADESGGVENGPADTLQGSAKIDLPVQKHRPSPILVAGGAILALGVAGSAIWFGGNLRGTEQGEGMTAPVLAMDASEPATEDNTAPIPSAEQPVAINLGSKPQDMGRLIAAFAAAFSADGLDADTGSVTLSDDTGTFEYQPVALYSLGGDRHVLFSIGVDPAAGHSSTGVNAIHYLQGGEGGYRLIRGFFGYGATGSVGNGATSWALSRALAPNPVLLTAGGGTWQGCSVETTVLTELGPQGPRDIGSFESAASGGAGSPVLKQKRYSYEGKITSVDPGKSFTVTYVGTEPVTRQWIMQGGAYVGQGTDRLPGC